MSRDSRGRFARVPAVPNPTGQNEKKLTDEQEREMVNDYRAGMLMKDILEKYSVGTTSLYHVLQREGVPLRRPGRGAGVKPTRWDVEPDYRDTQIARLTAELLEAQREVMRLQRMLLERD